MIKMRQISSRKSEVLQVTPRTPKNLITSSMEIVDIEKVWVTNKYDRFLRFYVMSL